MNPLLEQRLQLFPVTTRVTDQPGRQELLIGGLSLRELAEQYGTPLYVYDRATIDAALQEYRSSLTESYPGSAGITYAGKAFLCRAMAEYVRSNDLWLDCTGAGELRIAQAARVLYEKIVVHGVSKSRADLEAALEQAGVIVVDHPAELKRLFGLLESHASRVPEIWLRYRPGIAVETHRFTQTGQNNSKFGMSAEEIEQSVVYSLGQGLHLKGLHFHLGSHFHNPAPLKPAVASALDLIAQLGAKTGWLPDVLCVGGGWGVPYHTDDLPHRSISEYVAFTASQLVDGCRERGLPLPRLQLEPGRSLIARAGVAVYETIAVKRTTRRRWLLLDGGLADNPRPALYRARYTALPAVNPGRPIRGSVWIGGPYCESGDILIEHLPFGDIEPGEYLAVPVSGAYQISMSSNYNGARRPAVVWIANGLADLIQRRETLDDLIRRDLPLPD